MRYTSTVKLPLRRLPKDQKVLKGVHLWEAKCCVCQCFCQTAHLPEFPIAIRDGPQKNEKTFPFTRLQA